MTVSLQFPLRTQEGWPPVGSESLPFDRLHEGYRLLSPPLFLQNLSVEDVITITIDELGFVSKWQHFSKSGRSVVWLLRLSSKAGVDFYLAQLREIGCKTTGIDEFGSYSVDVPEHVEMHTVDMILDIIDPSEIAVAFPSMRHAG